MDFLGQVWDFYADNLWGPNGVIQATLEQIYISVLSTLAAIVLGLVPALYLGHHRRGGAAAVAVVNIGRAIPSFAILVLALPVSLALGLGLSFWPSFIALVIMALPPIFTNTYTGIVGVEPATVEAARGVGMRERRLLWTVELALAAPLILTGIRVATVNVIATATLGAYVGFGGLGAFIVQGFALNDNVMIVAGALLVSALAIVVLVGFYLLQRFALPPGIRRVTSVPRSDDTAKESRLEAQTVEAA